MTLHDLPDIAAGDVLGSCMLNIVIIALLDLKIGGKPLAVHNDCHRHHRIDLSCGTKTRNDLSEESTTRQLVI